MSTKMLEQALLKAAVAVDQHTLGFYMLAFSKMPDKQGDMIAADAADEWLKSFYAAGNPLPISFTHSAVTDPGNPFNIIGYAPADAEHVFKDGHGIRVIANLDTADNPTAAQVYTLAKRGIVTGSSVAYFTTAAGQTLQEDGSTLITKIEDIIECGPCLDPANEDAFIFAVKTMEAVKKATLDESGWDANRAMGQCNTAADYRSICAGEKSEGDPDQRQHWALPHHYLGRSANAAGVAAARARFNQTEGLSNASTARTHLFETHRLPSDSTESSNDRDDLTLKQLQFIEATVVSMKAGRVISAANLAKLRAAQEVINELLAFGEQEIAASTRKANANGDEPQANPEEQGPDADLRRQLASFTT